MTRNGGQSPTDSKESRRIARLHDLAWLLEAPRRVVLLWAALLAAIIASLDYGIHPDISVGVLYVIPMVLAALTLRVWQLLLLGAIFALITEAQHPLRWDDQALGRIFYTLVGFCAAGIMASEIVRGRRLALQVSRKLEEQIELRREAENQLLTLIESSPAAILTLDTEGRIDLANQAAHQLFGVAEGGLQGTSVRRYLPVMADLLEGVSSDFPYRTATNCRGRRADGEMFLACVWFATFPTRSGRRLAAIITDSSEDLRDWQETSLQSLLRSTRVLVGSVSHEIRNICAAIAVVHANLGRVPGVAATEDYSALGTLAQGLARLTTVELQASGEQELGGVNMESLLEEFRIVVGPTLVSQGIELSITLPPDLPLVLGDHHGLLQVLLNLVRNSTRALEGCEHKHIAVDGSEEAEHVLVTFRDSGRGVADPGRLFQPFQQGADAVGLGLFVSRAIVRACEGEMYHEPSRSGCTIRLRLKPYLAGEASGDARSTEIQA